MDTLGHKTEDYWALKHIQNLVDVGVIAVDLLNKKEEEEISDHFKSLHISSPNPPRYSHNNHYGPSNPLAEDSRN